MRTDYLKLFAASLLAGGVSSAGQLYAQGKQPNIILILADDQGWGDLSFNGNLSVSTPNIDRIASEGASFSNFYVCPVSSPTRAELLTGRYAARGGVRDVSRGGERLNLNEVTIANYFKEAGYTTGAFGKWHSGTQYPYHPNARGFDEFYGFCSGHWGNYWSPMLEHNGEIVTGTGFIIDDLTSKAIGYIKENKDSPFFVYLPYNTPHSPMQVPDKWWNLVKDREIKQGTTTTDEENMDFTKAALALTENIDWNVGRVMDAINGLGLDENTIILYLTDNGPNSNRWNAGMTGRKGSTDEGGVRSPLFIRWPGQIQAGTIINQLSGAIDLMPTLLDLSGKLPRFRNEIDGISLKPIFGNPQNIIPRTLFSHWNKRKAVRTQDFLLNFEGKLYNTAEDRTQKHDLSETDKGKTAEMKRALAWYEDQVLSLLPEKDTRPFTIAHPAEKFSKLPARDGTPHGGIERSCRHPNNSYFLNWTKPTDSITWNVKVEEAGRFEVIVYYTCAPEDVGSTIQVSVGENQLSAKLTKANDVPMLGAELDRVPRQESYVKGFAPFSLGQITLTKGEQKVSIHAPQIPGEEVMYFQMLVFMRKP
ncbi:MAG: arylsulfatase [Tannerellaceae bacterium]|jgi:arylsulfatase A-like enzyme|nr:arylsulfatase [Tannerellaceae bacterium]